MKEPTHMDTTSRSATGQTSWREKLIHQNARQRLFIALGTALLAFLFLGQLQLTTRMVAAWDSFTLCFLAMSYVAMMGASLEQIRRNANAQDSGRRFVFVFALIAACVSLLAVVVVLRTSKDFKGVELALHLGLSVLAVVSSWLLIHMTFAFRYAHMYYAADCPDDNDKTPDGQVGGLEFPGDEQPDYLDFAYFAFVIGMTFQVSDVEISSRALRRLTLLHSLLSFAFNTMIVALSINIISSLLE